MSSPVVFFKGRIVSIVYILECSIQVGLFIHCLSVSTQMTVEVLSIHMGLEVIIIIEMPSTETIIRMQQYNITIFISISPRHMSFKLHFGIEFVFTKSSCFEFHTHFTKESTMTIF